MNKLNYKDDLQMTTHSASQETQILSDYLSELERLVVQFENERTQDNMNALAFEATRSIAHLVYLNNNVLDKLVQIDELTSIDVDIEEV
ncbi:hypothetical protein ACN68I_03240 [Aerococcus viridans]|uniref:hypothetical protein n=1 Tax=Aerococcus viridans TaxID=1377 RepID=UPI003B20E256